MSGKENKYRFLLAGGGTGGHLFPAVAVADKIKSLIPEAEILFVGTKSKIEGKSFRNLVINLVQFGSKDFQENLMLKIYYFQ